MPRNPTLFRAPPALVYGGLAVALLAAFGTVVAHYWPDLRWVAAPVEFSRPPPRRAAPTRLDERMAEEVVSAPVAVKRPTPKQAAKLEDRYDLKLEEVGAVLAEVETGKLPHGGTALVTLDEAGETRVTIAPNRPPLFELGGPWKLGGGVLHHLERGPGFRLRAGKDLGRVWRVTVTAEADLDVYGGEAAGLVYVGGEVRF